MSKEIQLTKGKVALVDDEDFIWLSRFTWCADSSGYAMTFDGQKNIRMHTMLIRPPKGMVVDHINGNPSDNQRKNLRICTRAENLRNRGKQKNNSSGYKGVYWSKGRKKWIAQIKIYGKMKSLGGFEAVIDAVKAYDLAALQIHGEFAKTNLNIERLSLR